MLRNWNVLKLTSLMAVAVAVTPIPAVQAKQTDFGTTELEKLKDAIDLLNKKLDKLLTATNSGFEGVQADMARIGGDLIKIKGDIKSLNDASEETKLTLQTALGKIKLLESQVALLKSDLDKLQPRDKTSLYPPEKGLEELRTQLAQIQAGLLKLAEARTSMSPPTNTGRIQLVNQYPETMLFVVNGKSYRVDPFTSVTLPDQPAGMFKYEVISGTFGLRAVNTPVLDAGKTYTITVR